MSLPIALVTGANQGIGLAVAQILAKQHSYHVIIGSRNIQAGEDVASKLRSEGHQASSVQVDLASQSSIEAAANTIKQDFGYLDVLINNAGILIDIDESLNPWDLYSRTFTTNVIGTAVLTDNLIPLLRKAKAGPPRIVFVTSIMGSFHTATQKDTMFYNTDYKAYDASKAALNMLMLNYTRNLNDVGAKVNAVCPGLVKSNLTNYHEYGHSPEVGASRIVEMAVLGEDGPTGSLSDRNGPLAW